MSISISSIYILLVLLLLRTLADTQGLENCEEINYIHCLEQHKFNILKHDDR